RGSSSRESSSHRWLVRGRAAERSCPSPEWDSEVLAAFDDELGVGEGTGVEGARRKAARLDAQAIGEGRQTQGPQLAQVEARGALIVQHAGELVTDGIVAQKRGEPNGDRVLDTGSPAQDQGVVDELGEVGLAHGEPERLGDVSLDP